MPDQLTSKTVYLKDYQPTAFTIDTVDLIFYLYERGTRVRSRLTIHKTRKESDLEESLVLMGEALKPVWVRVDGSELRSDEYTIDDKSLTLLNPPDRFVLETEVELTPEKNTALQGLYRSGSMFCTQCEAEGFRRITWYLDRPDVMADFRTRIEADKDKYPVLLGNGNPVERGDLADGRHYAVWEDPFPKPSYLFALVAGNLECIEDKHTTPSGREIQLRIYVEPENIDKCEHAMQSLVKAMVWDEQTYGREYDLDVYNIVAVNDFNMGAMENKGLNIFNSKYVLASPATATDQDYLGIESVIAHEYFHNWTGNRITCRDWFQLSLKEGFTVYRDQEFSADMGSRGVKRIEDVRVLRNHQFPEDAGPMAHPVRPDSYMEINNFYTVTVYEKGAELVRMQANLLGAERFRAATDLYFERFDGQAVTTDDFVQCMEDVFEHDMSQFKYWYDYAGTPEVTVVSEYNRDKAIYKLTFSQRVPDTPGQSDKPAFHIPIAMGLLDQNGKDMPLNIGDAGIHDGMLALRKPEQEFVFTGVTEEPVPSLLRGFSAPVKLQYEYSDEELMFLMANDSDGFNRWDASQNLSLRLILGLADKYRSGGPMEIPREYLSTFSAALMLEDVEPALMAEVLALPAESYISEQMETVDVEAVYFSRQTVRKAIAEALEEELLKRYGQLDDRSDYLVTPEAIGNRSLKNLCLSYLMGGESDTARQLCIDQFNSANNMTDVVSALGLIVDSDHPERAKVLDEYAAKWRSDPLVMDKWFSVQALSRREDTLPNVMKLMQHEAFSIKNPNKVRALIGSFCAGNPLRFHSADGSGYRFLADRVLEIDQLNPQVAAKLLRSLARWRHFDTERQKIIREQLDRVSSTAEISPDVYEVASKSLQS